MSEGERECKTMDKKSARQSSVPPKGNGADSKKDSGSGQKFPRHKARRQQHGNNTHDHPRSSHRPPAPMPRGMDKRPRSRGIPHGNTRDEMTMGSRMEPEFGSVQSWGHKKNNLSHLLNFHFEPREAQRGGQSGGSGRRSRGRQYHFSPRFNKEHYLQANFQFAVRDSGDYTIHTVDPDALVDWDLIEQVRIYDHGMQSCPICLYPPRAAKTTRCGHVYCWSCILHYLSLGEKDWRRCPICYDAIIQKDLKSVKIFETHDYKVGEEITLKLMKRARGNTQAMPVDQWTDREGQLYNVHDDVDIQFAKLLVMSDKQVQDVVQAEIHELDFQLAEDGEDTLEGSFVKAALKLSEERLKTINVTLASSNATCDEVQDLPEADNMTTESKSGDKIQPRVVYKSAFDDEVEEEEEELKPIPEGLDPYTEDPAGSRSSSESSCDKDVSQLTEATVGQEPTVEATEDSPAVTDQPTGGVVTVSTKDGPQQVPLSAAAEELSIPQPAVEQGASAHKGPNNYFYFFQAMDGQNIYLHSLNAQCLVKEYGSLENSPTSITAKIVELNGVTMNEELRQRLRYLSHVPVTCEFQVAELALKPPILSQETLKVFSDKIEQKKRQRQRKCREERKFSQKLQNAENKKYGIDPRAVYVRSDAPVTQQPGNPTAEGYSSQSSPVGSPSLSGESDMLATSPKTPTSSDDGSQSMSFAQMLKAGKGRTPEAWGRPRTQSGGVDSAKDASDTEDRAPEFQVSFGDAIQKALDNYKGGEDPSHDVVPKNIATKKKKKLKTLLFTTSVNRAK